MLECSLTKYEEQKELDKYDYHMFSGDEIIHSKDLATDYELIFKNGNKGEFRLIDAEQSDICVENNRGITIQSTIYFN